MMEHALALRLASELLGDVADACERVEIAGSIRRRKPQVKDIELVAIPRWTMEALPGQIDLFSQAAPTAPVNLLQRRLEAIERVQVIKPGADPVPWHLTPDGRYWRLYLPAEDIKVDVFVCNEATWGLNYMIRTGSGVGPSGDPIDGFAPAMLRRWKLVSGGGQSVGSQLRGAQGGTHATPEERDVFEACRVRWVEPEQRLSSRDVERNALALVGAQ